MRPTRTRQGQRAVCRDLVVRPHPARALIEQLAIRLRRQNTPPKSLVIPAGVLWSRAGRELDQASEVRSAIRPDIRVNLPRQLWPIVADGGSVCVAPATAPAGAARRNARDRPAQDGHPLAIQDRRARQTVQRSKDRVRLHLPTSCPVKTLLAQICGRLCPASRKPVMLASP